ncbi:MAG: stage IV sporulation protein A [Clostridia bacterium]|nr:stage IV sporulation protein A [Clostridia bacterium]
MKDIYKDIAERTGGDIYIAVAGPVRTGKSTFIKRFSELLLLPHMENEYEKDRLTDELPQSGAGRSIMTTQPRFVPAEAVNVTFEEGVSCRCKLIDCVGYMVPGAVGDREGEGPRMVTTPWFDHDIPFSQAAEVGTTRVIEEHATISIVMTTDGTVTDIPRESYLEAERQAIEAAKAAQKPFVVVVNSVEPESETAKSLAEELAENYGVSTVAMDVKAMSGQELRDLITRILYAFPVKLVEISVPGFLRALSGESPLMEGVLAMLRELSPEVQTVGDCEKLVKGMQTLDHFKKAEWEGADLGTGTVTLVLTPEESMFYTLLSEETGVDIADDFALFSAIREFAAAKRAYDRLSNALEEAEQTGYGVVTPSMEEMELMEPEMFRQGGRCGVRLRARAKGLHIVKVDIDTEVSPLIGSEEQAKNLMEHLNAARQEDVNALWQTSFFGKTLQDMVTENMQGKLGGMPVNVQQKMQGTIERMVNEDCNGLICILL